MFDFTLSMMNLIEIGLLLLACYLCYLAGKFNGCMYMVNVMLENNIITEKQLEELSKKVDT